MKGLALFLHVGGMNSLFFNAEEATGANSADQSDNCGTTAGSVATDDPNGDQAWRRHRFREIYKANHDDLWKYCLRRAASPEEAEEALSETFAIAWRRLDIVPTGNDARPWLFGVARNQLRSGWRKYRRTTELRDRLVSSRTDYPSQDPADAVDDGASTVLAALATLRERDQEVLRLAAWEELPHAEIAVLIGCSENAVAIRIHRARQRLEKAVAKMNNSFNQRTTKQKVKGRPISTHVVSEGPATTSEGGPA